MTPEGKVKERVKTLLRQYGAYWHMPVQNGMGAPSLDFICCLRGRYFAIETKKEADTMTPRQEVTAGRIADAGGAVFLVNEVIGMRELEQFLTEVTA